MLKIYSPPAYQSESATSLRTIIDHFKGHISAIKSLNTEVPFEDLLLTRLVLKQLDVNILKELENEQHSSQFPTLSDFFLILRI
jgi:hypothetical protein